MIGDVQLLFVLSSYEDDVQDVSCLDFLVVKSCRSNSVLLVSSSVV